MGDLVTSRLPLADIAAEQAECLQEQLAQNVEDAPAERLPLQF